MLETLGDSTIHRMTVEEPEKAATGWFNAGEEISPAVAEELKAKYQADLDFAKQHHNAHGWISTPRLILDMQKIGLKEGVDHSEISGMKWMLESVRQSFSSDSSKWLRIGMMTTCMKDLGCDIDLTDIEMARIKDDFQKSRKENNPNFTAYYATILTKLGINPEISTEDEESMAQHAHELKQNQNWTNYMVLTKRMAELNIGGINFSQDDIRHMKDSVLLDANLYWIDKIHLAANMQELSSMVGSVSQLAPTEKMPEERKF